MCGIVGARHDWLVANGFDPESAMRSAVEALRWRGPDGVGVVQAGGWWLGCARLAIGPAKSQQPLVRRGGRFVGVMNGAITNARDLWARLMPGVEKRSQPPNDAWIPLLAVERGDPALLHDLCGHHAYAVADTSTGALFCGRDHFGQKPFFCTIERVDGAPELVAIASTPVALRRLGVRNATKLDSRQRSEWFRQGWFAPRWRPLHFGRERELLERGAPLRAPGDSSGAPASRWGAIRLAAHLSMPVTRETSLRETLITSVKRCADARVPVALSLSGGIDSSCLAFALAAANRRVPAYQLQTAGASPAERHAASVVATRTGAELRTVDVGVEALDALPFLTECAGAPLGDPSILAVHALARAAHGDGVRVLLGGEGADELFYGYRRYRALDRVPRLPCLRRFASTWSMRYGARWFRAVTAPDPVLALLAVTPPAFGTSVLAPELGQRRCWRDDSASPRGVHGSTRSAVAARTRDLQDEYLPFDLLPKVDIATLAAGVEARCPYLEVDVLTHTSFRRRELGKRLLLRAFASELPREVLTLPKTGFALPLDRWFRGELPWLDLLREPRTTSRPHLRSGGIARTIDLHRSGRADLGHALYLLVAYELYLRAIEDSPADAPKTASPA